MSDLGWERYNEREEKTEYGKYLETLKKSMGEDMNQNYERCSEPPDYEIAKLGWFKLFEMWKIGKGKKEHARGFNLVYRELEIKSSRQAESYGLVFKFLRLWCEV